MTRRRMRSQTVVLAVTPVLAGAFLSGCARQYDYAGVCTDRETHVRVDDDNCRDGYAGGPYGWYFLRTGGTFPRVGAVVRGGTATVPRGSSAVRGGVAAKGGHVSRGGFGRGLFSGGHVGG